METSRRGNYNSGEDFVLEYGELRFTFNEEDFSQRCEQAALKVGFVGGRLGDEELEDLVNLAVNGEITDPASALGEHVNDCWPELIGPAERSLVHWLRRLIFRGAWLDHQVKRGALEVVLESDVNILDIAALTVIVREAGGTFTDLEGRAVGLATTSVLATNGALHAEVLGILKET